MNVKTVLLAQAFRGFGGRQLVYIPALVNAMRERYGFVQVPQTVQEMLPADPDAPIEFLHGKIEREGRTIVIRCLRFFSMSLMADTATSTDDSDFVIADAVDCVASAVGVKMTELRDRRIYVSQLEVTMQPALEKWLHITNPVGAMVAKLFASYDWENVPPFEIASIRMSVDQTKIRVPCEFQIERRVNVAYEDNTYFSQAPLSTADHIAVLDELERTMKTPD